MNTLSPERLLKVWETGARYHPLDRALLLFALAEPGIDPAQLANEPLSRRNATVMALRCAHFGPMFSAWVDCRQCGERMEIPIDTSQLPPPPPSEPTLLQAAGLHFRRPTSQDLAQISGAGGAGHATRQLATLCAVDPNAMPEDPSAIDALVNELGEVLEQQDPWTDLVFSVVCPACAHGFDTALDSAALLWDELEALAQRTLDEVHTLASAYGWQEDVILGMTPARRSAYLGRLQA